MSHSVAVTFAVEAGPGVGLGHLRRAQALAATLRARGAVVRFLVDGESDAADPETRRLAWTREPGCLCAALAECRPDAIVVDSYRAAPELFERLRPLARCVVAIDDLADRPLPAHLVVNGALHAACLAYRGAPDTAFLLGPEYALLEPGFGDAPASSPAGPVRRVLVTLGGGTAGTALGAVVTAVRRAVPAAAIDLALGPLSDDAVGGSEGVTLHRGLPSLRELLRHADLAVTGGGMTLYECLASGTPAVGVCLADNQRANVDALSRAGLIVSGEPSLEAAVRRVAGDAALRRRMSAEGRQRVDGRGAERVATEVARVCAGAGAVRSAR
jgi:spore coat polysaccharide biosynthesis predicted glycosyltransferase SpsG